MSYLGNSPPSQNFVAGADQFSGTGSQTAFTLSRNVNTVFDIFVTVSNVPQDPFTAYTVAGNTLTFDGAPPSGTNNIDVVYRATNVQTFVPSPGVSPSVGNLNFIGTGNRITGDFSNATDANRVLFQTTTANTATVVGAVPNGTSTFSYFQAYNTSTGANAATLQLGVNGSIDSTIRAGVTGTGTYLPMTFYTGGSEAMRIDTSRNVGIGTSTPESISNFRFLDVGSSGTNQGVIQANNGTVKTAIYTSGVEGYVATRTNHNLNFQVNGNNQAGITTAGLFQFNSGYGSVATAYGCRAWVNFNGTGTVAISASGNVSSITDNGVGDYTVNFTNAMPDVNYCACGMFRNSNFLAGGRIYSTLTGSVSFNNSTSANVAVDSAVLGIAIFR